MEEVQVIEQPKERVLPDDYPVFPEYLYVVDGEVRRCMVEGTVATLKDDLRKRHGLKAEEVKNCDISARGLWEQAV